MFSLLFWKFPICIQSVLRDIFSFFFFYSPKTHINLKLIDATLICFSVFSLSHYFALISIFFFFVAFNIRRISIFPDFKSNIYSTGIKKASVGLDEDEIGPDDPYWYDEETGRRYGLAGFERRQAEERAARAGG